MNPQQPNATPVRVRFAPSPTGPLHIGGVRTALYNYLFAKQHNGTFILRIEDTDQKRFVHGAETYIQNALEWCGMIPDESPKIGGAFAPYRQSDRKAIYQTYVQQLLDKGFAYYAFDTPEELEQMRAAFATEENPTPPYDALSRERMCNALTMSPDELASRLAAGDPYVVRLKVVPGEPIVFEDLVRGLVRVDSEQLDDKILMKADGMPTYHLANIVDDHLMRITHVIRGEEWLPSTPHHVLMYRYFGWEQTMPQFMHLPLILKPVGKGKLSKRDGDKMGFPVFPLDWQNPDDGEKASGFRERGFLPQAVVNFLALLGWNPGTEQEIFSMDELVAAFDIRRISKHGARFDFDKAKWFNQHYLIHTPVEQLLPLLRSVLAQHGQTDLPDDFLKAFCNLYRERVIFLDDFWAQGHYFFEPISSYDEKTIRKKWKAANRPLFEALVETLETTQLPFDAENIKRLVSNFTELNALKFGDVLPILRVGLTGTMQGPDVFATFALFGKERFGARLRHSFDTFDTYGK